MTGRWVFDHCKACADLDAAGLEGTEGHDPGVGCPAEGPGAEGCEAVWLWVDAERPDLAYAQPRYRSSQGTK